MIARIIDASIANRLFIVLAAIAVTLGGFWAVRTTPVDALPDLSDVQVVVRSNYPGQAPRIVEDQVTYPMATTMLSVPGAKTVRGYSFFGDSYVYVIFEDGTDLYWARSRVLEYLNQVQNRLPDGVQSTLGPDATGVGWIYEYALVDRSGGHDLAGLRSLQDWFLRYELKTIPGIAEVASVGGMVKQYQIVLDPYRMASLGVTHAQVVRAVQAGNQETGGSIVEMGEAEYMVRASGYLGDLDDFRAIPLRAVSGGVPVTLGDVATIQVGPELRRGIAELNGEGEVAGGIIVLRQGADARSAIQAVELKLDELQASLPEGVEIVTTYDRSQLIDASIENLTTKLPLEFAPGQGWNYSVATDVLGIAVERISGMRLGEYFAKHIFAPLGMADTGFGVAEGQSERLVDAYAYRPGQAPRMINAGATSKLNQGGTFDSGGGGLIGTIEDYHRFATMLLNGGELDGARIISPKTLRLMRTNHLPGNADLTEMSSSLFSEANNAGTGFGLGFAMVIDPARTLMPSSLGEFYWGGAYSTAFFVDPVERITMVFMTQVYPSSTYPIRRQLKTLIYSALTETYA